MTEISIHWLIVAWLLAVVTQVFRLGTSLNDHWRWRELNTGMAYLLIAVPAIYALALALEFFNDF